MSIRVNGAVLGHRRDSQSFLVVCDFILCAYILCTFYLGDRVEGV